MAANAPFPIGATSTYVRLANTPSPVDGLPPRGADGLRPGVVIFPMVDLESAHDTGLQPIVAIYVAQLQAPTAPTEGVTMVDALDRCTWSLFRMESDDPADASPLDFEYEIRGSLTGVSETVFAGVTNLSPSEGEGGNVRGNLVQVAGYLCTQWELWARLSPDFAPSGTTRRVRLAAIVDRIGGVFQVTKGSLTA